MENVFKQYQEFRQKNQDYFAYCQQAINEIADRLVASSKEYQDLVHAFEQAIQDKKQEMNDRATKLEEMRKKIMELDAQLKEESRAFETMYRAFEDHKHALKQTEQYKELNKLDEMILDEFEKTLQNPSNKFHAAYTQELELIKALKDAQEKAHDGK